MTLRDDRGTTVSRPIRLAIVNDYAVVIAGLASFLAEEGIDVVETGASVPVVSDVDLVLYDTFGQIQGDGIDLEGLRPRQRREGGDLQLEPPAGPGPTCDRGRRLRLPVQGAHRTGDPGGSRADRRRGGGRPARRPRDQRRRSRRLAPGRSAGLSPREAEILALITLGLSNQEIADRAYLSINSVKTYIRSAYRKIGVDRRAMAVLWGVAHGFEPDHQRIIHPRAVGLPL